MQENGHYIVGLDVGTTKVRCVVGYEDPGTPGINVIGSGEARNSGGMRKGVVVNIVNTAQAIDKALDAAERMSGFEVHAATVSINGAHITGMSSRGVVAAGAHGHEISEEDLARVLDAATIVQMPANQEILQTTPRSFQLDGQDNIKDPVGMQGMRLEVDAHVITALAPNVRNLEKAVEMTKTSPRGLAVSSLAAARAVLNEQHIENGVVLIDLGGTTTNIAVFEDGDLQHVAVLPVGSVNITNDLAIGLRTDLAVAEQIKLEHAIGGHRPEKEQGKKVGVTHDNEKHEFDIDEIDMIVGARLEEIFEMIDGELATIKRAGKLPGGAVLTGGGALMKGIELTAREHLRMSARIATLQAGLTDVSGVVHQADYAVAVGLMLLDSESGGTLTPAGGAKAKPISKTSGGGGGGLVKSLGGFLKKLKP
ncbi:cell division protein FtsA [Candidatus Saccharibacteria bacterium]|nr:cell division protein FtsA [Candidatus Saccharibacteria bacterium]